MKKKNKLVIDKLMIDDQEVLDFVSTFVGDTKHTEQFFEISIKEKKSQRSLQQNAFFHGPLLQAFVDHTGFQDVTYLKFALKDRFLRVYIENKPNPMVQKAIECMYWLKEKVNNQKVHTVLDYVIGLLKEEELGKYYIQNTSDLNVEQMRMFLDKSLNFLSELGGHLTTTEYDDYMSIYK